MSAFWDKLKKDKKAPEKDKQAVEKDIKQEVDEVQSVKKTAAKPKKESKNQQPAKAEKDEEQQIAEQQPKEDKEAKKDKKGKKEKKSKKKKKKGFPQEHAILINNIVLRPKVSEAALNQNTLAKYVFHVSQVATKNEVAKAVAAMYGVRVRKVNMINYGPQTKRFRGYAGTKKGFKKAIVSLEKGQSIDVFSE